MRKLRGEKLAAALEAQAKKRTAILREEWLEWADVPPTFPRRLRLRIATGYRLAYEVALEAQYAGRALEAAYGGRR